MSLFSRLFGRRRATEAAPQAAPAAPAEDAVHRARALRAQRLREAVAAVKRPDASPIKTWEVAKPAPGVVPDGTKGMAQDSAIDSAYNWAQQSQFAEGLGFLGYPYLAELAQRPEYRMISGTLATEMTRKWIRLVSTGTEEGGRDLVAEAQEIRRQYREADPADTARREDLRRQWLAIFEAAASAAETGPKAEKLRNLEAALKRFKVRDAFRRAIEIDGFFGRAHIYLDLGAEGDELKAPIGDGQSSLTKAKINPESLKRLQVIEPVWTYPNAYNSADPLRADFFRPSSWFVMGKEVHASRLLTLVGREVPDLLKPAYAFGGLSLSQMAKPYVDNWLRTRQSVSDAVSNFSIMVLLTNLEKVLDAGASDQIALRADLFTTARDNQGVMIADKQTEDLKNVSMPLSGLNELQAQAQEHMAAVSRIPLVKLLGITPSGLNASSDGEIRCFYDTIEAAQEDLCTDPLSKVLNVIQLSEFGEIDPEIGFMFEPLWTLDAVALANKRKVEADTDCELIDHGVIEPAEARTRLAADEDSPYAALDLNKDIVPPEAPGGEGGDEDLAGLLGQSDDIAA